MQSLGAMSLDRPQDRFVTASVADGRILHVEPDGLMYLGRASDVLVSADDGETWTELLRLPRSRTQGVAEPSRLIRRLLRHEARALAVLSDSQYVVSNREDVFYARAGDSEARHSNMHPAGLVPRLPMRVSVGPNDTVVWGEYFGNLERREVLIYASDDGGEHFEVAHVFPSGEVRHVHNVVYDEAVGHYWVMAGDYANEPGIGRLSRDFRDFEWVVKGSQIHRAVALIDLGDYFLYGTDTEVETNHIMRFEKRTGRVESVHEIEGSCLHGCRFGSVLAFSTTVEPSPVNRSQEASLWLSRDGDSWSRVFQAAKDSWSPRYFQYGSLVLPSGFSDREVILFSGQAVEGIDGKALAGRWEPGV